MYHASVETDDIAINFLKEFGPVYRDTDCMLSASLGMGSQNAILVLWCPEGVNPNDLHTANLISFRYTGDTIGEQAEGEGF